MIPNVGQQTSTVVHDDTFDIESCEERDEWNEFIKQNDGPVFALREWGDTVRAYGYDCWHYTVRDRESGAIVGVLPLSHVESRVFGSKLLSPAFATRGSIMLDNELDDEDSTNVIRLLLEWSKQLATDLDVDVVTLRGSRVTEAEGFVKKNSYTTFEVPVDKGIDTVWSGVSESRQQHIKRAVDDPSLQFRVADSLTDLREFYELYLVMMRDLGNPSHSFEFFRTLWNQLYDDGNLQLSMIHRKDSLVNASINLSLGSTVYQYCTVSQNEHSVSHGGSWLVWKVLQWASENGYETYYLGRTRENSGAYTFKKSFGGSKVWYDDLHYFPGKRVNLSDPEDTKYRRARGLWRRLPVFVSRVLGPSVRKRIGL